MKKIISSLSLFLFGLILSLPEKIWAAGLGDANNNLSALAPKIGVDQTQTIGTIVGNIIAAVLSLVGVIFLALMVYAGYLWMTAAGESAQIDKAKKIITASIVGLVITLSAYAITFFITSKLGSIG